MNDVVGSESEQVLTESERETIYKINRLKEVTEKAGLQIFFSKSEIKTSAVLQQKDLIILKEEPLDINSDIPKDPLAIEDTNLVKSENVKVENEAIMNEPVNNSFNNEALPLSKDIKLENEPDNVGDMICILLPNHRTETNISFEHKKRFTTTERGIA
ncbi:uncharacterized protein LOC142321125 [Lycorma delicatula]|uniref:uncharacterized protein LOC142321125 n=1 Tax=Lycorma delicatula TaxID=130591 RepID=UPI003F511C6E